MGWLAVCLSGYDYADDDADAYAVADDDDNGNDNNVVEIEWQAKFRHFGFGG